MGSPVILDANPNPLDIATGAIASYMSQKKANQKETDDKKAAAAALEAANTQQKVENDQKDQGLAIQRAHEAEVERHNAQEELHTARADALAALKEEHANVNAVRKMELEYRLGLQKLANAKTVEEIRAASQQAVANIHASASIQVGAAHDATSAANNAATNQAHLRGIQMQQAGRAAARPDPREEHEYDSALRQYNAQVKSGDASAIKPTSPLELQANVESAVSKIGTDPHKLHAAILKVRSDPSLTPYQKLKAEQLIRQGVQGGQVGGSTAADPFLQSLGL